MTWTLGKGQGEGQEGSLDILDAFHTWKVEDIHDPETRTRLAVRVPPLYVCWTLDEVFMFICQGI